jgi:hypothetical protein
LGNTMVVSRLSRRTRTSVISSTRLTVYVSHRPSGERDAAPNVSHFP